MKIITYSKVGYNHPSNANWSYCIFKVDLIDTTSTYAMSWTVKETFGGDTRFKNEIEKITGVAPIESKGVLGIPKITGVAKMQDMESKEFINEVIKLYA